jgi:poly(A) polymerase
MTRDKPTANHPPMTESPDSLPSKKVAHRDDAVAIVRRLRDSRFTAYFAGGCVRDFLLGIEPQDYDVATDARPDDVRKLFAQTQAVGVAFGVMLVRQGRSVIEVATFRSDGNYSDGRRPDAVRFTDAREDALRRDFTINGLFQDPLTGQVIDYVGGQDDLAARRLRAIGQADHRFAEDHLRLLRAVRFAARFGLTIEPATAAAMTAHARELRHISPERVAEELRMMLTPPTRRVALPLLEQFSQADVIFRFARGPEGPALDGHHAKPLPRLTDLMQHLPPEPISFGLALAATVLARQPAAAAADALFAALNHQAVAATARALRQSLRFSNDEESAMRQILESVGKLLTETPSPDRLPRVALLKRFLAGKTTADGRSLLRAIAAIGCFEHVIAALDRRLEELSASCVAPSPLITGDDLIAMGFSPGPPFKRLLDQLYDAQLEEAVTTKEQAAELARRLAVSPTVTE